MYTDPGNLLAWCHGSIRIGKHFTLAFHRCLNYLDPYTRPPRTVTRLQRSCYLAISSLGHDGGVDQVCVQARSQPEAP